MLTIHSHPPALHLPQQKLQTIKSRASQLLCKDTTKQNITVRKIAQFVGTANAAAVTILPAPLFYRSLQATRNYFQNQEGGDEQYSSSVTYQQGRAELVDGASQFMESLQPAATSQLDYRCSSLQGDDHGRTLVTDIGLVPHKLPGDASNLPSSSMLYMGHSSPPHSLSLHGKHYSNLIRKPQKRNDFPLPLHASQTNLTVVYVSEHFPSCQLPTWTSRYSGRQRVQGITGQMRLATPLQNLSQNHPSIGTTDNRFICI